MKERADMAINTEMNWEMLSKAIDQAWCKRKEEGHGEWHGYGQSCFKEDESQDCDCSGKQQSKLEPSQHPERRMLLMVAPDGNIPSLVKSLASRYSLSRNAEGKALYEIENMKLEEHVEASTAKLHRNIDVIVAEPFEQPEAGNFYRPSTLLHPGARVFSTSPELGDSTNGTIGAFLKARGTPPWHPAWLLSNKHVLLQQEQRLDSVEVRGAGQTLISREVQFKGLGDTVNLVDAAIARVMDRDEIEAIYDGIQIHCPHPMEPTLCMKVYKLGNATGVTAGRIISRLDKVFVQDANKRGAGFEFRDQYLIGSDTTFMANGDSGALVIGCGHPVALLFAMANKVKGLPKNMHFVPPFGLACSIVEVLDKLPKEGDSEWEIMLDEIHRKDCCCHPANDCACHKETCSCYKRHCICHAEYCPYYCSCAASQERHDHCTCKSGHARYGKECYCEDYHAYPKGSDFNVTICVDKSPQEVFNAINNVRGWWWSPREIEGETDKLHAEFALRHKEYHSKQKIAEFDAGKKVVWHVLHSELSFPKSKCEWDDARIVFEICERHGKIELRFTYEGLAVGFEYYGKNMWEALINGNLRNLIMTGKH